MKKKTAIMEFIDYINELNDKDSSEFDYYYQGIVNKAQQLLKKEREQIKEAVLVGFHFSTNIKQGLHPEFESASDYYNKTYLEENK
jgi:hypothetical protein